MVTRAITDEAIAELRARIGVERPSRRAWIEVSSKDAIRHYAEGIGDDNPLWQDEEYAKKTRYGCIIAPPFFLYCFGHGGGGGGLRGAHGLYAGDEWEFFQPVRVDDRISHKSHLADVIEKTGTFAGRTVFGITENVYTNQRGELVAKYRDSHARFERAGGEGRTKYSVLKLHHYSEEDLKTILEDYDREERRGANPRYWEDVRVGEELTPVVKGPLMVSDIIMWLRGCSGGFIRAHKARFAYFKLHPAAAIMDPEIGVPDVPERVHWEDALAQRIGMPGAYDYARQRISWMGHLLANWYGDDGFLKRLNIQLRRPNFRADTTWLKGKVSNKLVKDGQYLVECEIWAENQRKENSMIGNATVLLPSRAGGPVVLPARSL